MQRTVILSVIGRDRPGLTRILADAVLEAGGNWLESQLSRIAGRYVGAVLVRMETGDLARLEAAVRGIDPAGLTVALAPADAEGEADEAMEAAGRGLRLELVGRDRPGIVREVSAVLAQREVNIVTLETSVEPMPHTGGALFRARADLTAPPGLELDDLAASLERLSAEIMVDITLG